MPKNVTTKPDEASETETPVVNPAPIIPSSAELQLAAIRAEQAAQAQEDRVFAALVRVKMAAGLPREDAEVVARNQIIHDKGLAAEAAAAAAAKAQLIANAPA